MAGVLVAYFKFSRTVTPKNSFVLIGLALISFSIFNFNNALSWPSLYTVFPVIGTALILGYGSSTTWTGRAIGFKPFSFLGQISYSAYLWHYPLFAFAYIRLFQAPSIGLLLVLSVASFILAAISWYFVETPFRQSKFYHKASSWSLGGSLIVVTVIASSYLIITHGAVTSSSTRPSKNISLTRGRSKAHPHASLPIITTQKTLFV